MRFAAPWPWWVMLGLAAAFAAAVAISYRRSFAHLPQPRRRLLMGLRLAVFLLILLLLARPVRVEPAAPADLPVLPVLVDQSRSMGIADAGGARRLDAAVAAIRDDLIPALGGDARVELWGIGERLEPLDLADARPGARWSDLTGALAEVARHYADRPMAGVVLVSDGADTGFGTVTTPASTAPAPAVSAATGGTVPAGAAATGAAATSAARSVLAPDGADSGFGVATAAGLAPDEADTGFGTVTPAAARGGLAPDGADTGFRTVLDGADTGFGTATAAAGTAPALAEPADTGVTGPAAARGVLAPAVADTGFGAPGAPALPPVYTVGVGAVETARDREVLDLAAGRPAAAGSSVDLVFSTVGRGFGGEPFEVRVLEDGRMVRVVTVAPAGDGAVTRTVVPVSPGPEGATRYTVEIPVADGELVAENNVRRALVAPPRRPRRVLLVEGGPGYEHSFLKRVLRSDPGVVVDAVIDKGRNDLGERTFYVQAAPDRAPALAGGYPATREALFRYDVLVLGNVEPERLSPPQIESAAAFVSERGGGLLVMGARSFAGRGFGATPLEALLPLRLREEDRFGVLGPGAGGPPRIALTPDGERHPVMRLGAGAGEAAAGWAKVPALGGVVPLGPPRPGAAVLAVAAGGPGAAPVVAVQRFGRGRTMVFAGEASWRWRMLAPSTDRTYERFWRQTMRWLGGGAPERVTLLTEGGRSEGEALHIEVAAADERFAPLADARVRVRVRNPDGDEHEHEASPRPGRPGRYVVEVRPGGSGVHRVTAVVEHGGGALAPEPAAVLVGRADPELSEPRRDDRLLRALAQASGGRSFELGGVAGLADAVRAGLGPPPAPVVRDAWDSVWGFLAIVGLLSAEWGLRRRWGLR